MSNPFAINPGGVLNIPGIGDTLSGSIAGVLQAQQEREKLRREQEEFQSKQAYFATLNEGNKLDNETKKRKLKDEERQLQAKSTGLDAFSQWAGSGARFEDAGKIVAAIKDPDTAQDFLNRVKVHLETMNQAALAKGNEADADVKVATKDEAIGQAETDASRSASQARVATATEGAQITGAKAGAREAVAKAQVAEAAMTAPVFPDPQLVNAARALWKDGDISRKDAFRAFGLEVPQGLDPEEKAPAGGSGGFGSIDKRRGQIAYNSATAANDVMTALEKGGVRIGSYTDLAAESKVGNIAITPQQRQLVQARNQFGQMYALFVTGQAASDPLLRKIDRTMVPASFDDEGTLQQKALMRRIFLSAMGSSYGEGKPASETLQVAVENARAMGLPMDKVTFLQNAMMDATNAEIKRGKDRAAAPILVPSEGYNEQDVDSFLGSYDFGGSR
jgi:hypothetical protein